MAAPLDQPQASTTGAAYPDDGLRKRNVPGAENQYVAPQIVVEDHKKLQKV